MKMIANSFYICVLCIFIRTSASEILIRLSGSTLPERGRLEVSINGTWGTVRKSGFGLLDANVVCRQLGYSVPVAPYLVGHFGQGDGMPIHMTHVTCRGNESTIFDCSYERPSIDDTNHENDIGIICRPADISDYHVRLRDGNTDNSGRVEVYLDGSWGSICSTNWNLNDATVVCRNLDFAAADAYHLAGDVGDSSLFHLYDVACIGTESGLRYCRHKIYNFTDLSTCRGGHAVGITCLQKEDFQVRLVGSNYPNEGRIEVLLEKVWSSIFYHDEVNWELNEADVVCKSLGFEVAYAAVKDGKFGLGRSSTNAMFNVNCLGNENNIKECVYEVRNDYNNNGTKTPVGVTCSSKDAKAGDIRLVRGKSKNEGRLEIHHFGKWGTICLDGWTSKETDVACKEMGYASGNSTIQPIPGPKGMAIHLTNVKCSGFEEKLLDCQHNSWEIHNCSHKQDVSIACNHNKDYDVKLVGGQVASEGTVEIYYDFAWGAVCTDDLTIEDAHVVCRSQGFTSANIDDHCGYFAYVAEQFHKMELNCVGSESHISLCTGTIRGVRRCNSPACIRCIMTYEDRQMRLVGEHTPLEGVPVIKNADTGQFDVICDNNITHYDKNVVCRSMGFKSAKINYHLPAPLPHTYSSSKQRCYVKDIACKGIEVDVRDCQTNEKSVATVETKEAYIFCSYFEEHTIRLVGGALPREGRLEIYHRGQWGTVCSKSWSAEDTAVVCRSLGLGPPPSNSTSLKSVPGIGPIHLTNVACVGTEDSLINCMRGDWGINTCSHEDDVMIKCSGQLSKWCGDVYCKQDEVCILGSSFTFVCQPEFDQESSGNYLPVILPILVFFVLVAFYVTMRMCQALPVQPHKECINLLRKCCGKKPSNYRIVLTTSDEVMLVENAS